MLTRELKRIISFEGLKPARRAIFRGRFIILMGYDWYSFIMLLSYYNKAKDLVNASGFTLGFYLCCSSLPVLEPKIFHTDYLKVGGSIRS